MGEEGVWGGAFHFAVIVFFLGGNQSDAGVDGFIGNCDVVQRRRTLEMRLEERWTGVGRRGGGIRGGRGEERQEVRSLPRRRARERGYLWVLS